MHDVLIVDQLKGKTGLQDVDLERFTVPATADVQVKCGYGYAIFVF